MSSLVASRAVPVVALCLCLLVAGVLPAGQPYRLRPTSLWWVKGSAAVVEGRELGRAGPLPEQATIGSVPIPNRGLFAFGSVVCGPSVEAAAAALDAVNRVIGRGR